MSDNELILRMEALESRAMHQEAAIEELTRTLLNQERLLATQAAAIRQLESQLQTLQPRNIALSEDEKPPPHY